jgi:hypothetical protein
MKNISNLFAITLVFLSIQAASQESNSSFFSKKQQFDESGTELYANNLEMKAHKKLGAGLTLGGALGQLGALAEINLDPNRALLIGMGNGPGYGTFTVQGKYNFEALYMSPYVKAGYSKWFSAGKVPSDATGSDVLRQIYSQADLKAGRFDANFVLGTFGAEYNQLEGELAGVNFFGEMTLMSELQTARLVPTGSVGIIYFY